MPVFPAKNRFFDYTFVNNVHVFTGDFDISRMSLDNLYEIFGKSRKTIRRMKVKGNFNCCANILTDLWGLPDELEVLGDFDCSHNLLKTLAGLPENLIVHGKFDCSYNELSRLHALPNKFTISGNVRCVQNKITSISGFPERLLKNRVLRKEIPF